MSSKHISRIEEACQKSGMMMTSQRRVVARILSNTTDHLDVEELHRLANAQDPSIAIATVYRTVRLFEEAGILERHDFGDGRAHYEEAGDEHHDHMIDVNSGKVIEFYNKELEALQEQVAAELGYRLVGHKMELFAVPLDSSNDADEDKTNA